MDARPLTPELRPDTPVQHVGARRTWWRFWRYPIGLQSLLAVALGAILGSLAPVVGEQLKIMGDAFLSAVQMVVVPLVFPLIVLGNVA